MFKLVLLLIVWYVFMNSNVVKLSRSYKEMRRIMVKLKLMFVEVKGIVNMLVLIVVFVIISVFLSVLFFI